MKRAVFCGLLSGALMNLAFAPLDQGYLTLVVFLPLLTLNEAPWRQRLVAGWTAGLVAQGFGYYWIFYTIRDFGGLNEAMAVGGGCLFWLYQGLDIALWCLLAPMLFGGVSPWLKAAGFAALWMLIQTAWFPYIFPSSLGAAANGTPLLRQSAALWSTDGLCFWLVFVQAVLYFYRSDAKWRIGRLSMLALGTLTLVLAGGLFTAERGAETWRVGVVQPNLIPWAKRGAFSGERLLAAHYQPSLAFKDLDVDLVVWPETALAFDLRDSAYVREQLTALAYTLDAAVVTGAVGTPPDGGYYNEIWMFTPDGGPPQIYQKEKLVLFGEHVPLLLRWVEWVGLELGGFDAGRENRVFSYRGKNLVPLVCFEALFPGYVHRMRGHLLLNLTNDAWFGETKASGQHLQHVQGRAVEHGAPLIRATNSGISCHVDVDGRIHGATGIYVEAHEVYEVRLPEDLPAAPARYGGGLMLGLAYAVLLWGLWHFTGALPRRRRAEGNRGAAPLR